MGARVFYYLNEMQDAVRFFIEVNKIMGSEPKQESVKSRPVCC